MSESIDIKSNRRNLVILFSIGFVPLIFAWIIFFYFPGLMPSGTTNEGQFISPPVKATELGIELNSSKWALLIPVQGTCDEACEQRFYLARQVNVALGKETERVRRVMLDVGGDFDVVTHLRSQFPDQSVAKVDTETFRRLLKDPEAIYFMDPLGNIFMFYAEEKAGKPMLKDIKHLLKISNIG